MNNPTAQTKEPKESLSVSFEDNRLLAELLGEYDRNLVLLEEKLGLDIHAHGNVLTLTGSLDQCKLGKDVLLELYQRIVKGHEIAKGDIEGAIRHAHAGNEFDVSQHQKSSKTRAANETGEMSQAQIRTRKKHVIARTINQSQYIRAIEAHDLVFSTGPAGTGKTYIAVAAAAAALEQGLVDRIILSRPAVEAGERLGFLPGDMREKVDPYLRPLYDALYDCLPAERVEKEIENGIIEIAPLAFMRGRTLANSFIILDEAQNCTAKQMKMFLTRLGENAKMVVTGDPSQVDLPKGEHSGLVDAIAILKSIRDIGRIDFDERDVVRRELVAKIVAAYDKKEGRGRKRK